MKAQNAKKDRISIEISQGGMLATIIFNVDKNELELSNRGNLAKEVGAKLKECGVIFGIKSEVFMKELANGIKYVIAEGQPCEGGTDSIINMFQLPEVKPEAVESEKIDYYNLSLITTVDADTWLGERIEANEGKEGQTVEGAIIKPKIGDTLPLYYDKKTVYEVKEGNKTILLSKAFGAVYYKGKDIAIMNPLVIEGDVDFRTGNVVFDGCVIIKGTVCDGFYVEATGDIEINGELGLGNIKGLVSKQGSIYVKGGILSKGGVKIEAEKNVYVKFAENVTIECGGNAHIGFYSSNSFINAREIIIDSPKGQIMGGVAKAHSKIICPIIGSEIGRKTVIEIIGFNRAEMKCQYEQTLSKIKELKEDYERIKLKIPYYSSLGNLTDFQHTIYNNCKERIVSIRVELKDLAEKREFYDNYLKTRGDGEVRALKKIYPNTIITIKKKTIDISQQMMFTTYIHQDGKLIQL